jgi:hypothetical protein
MGLLRKISGTFTGNAMLTLLFFLLYYLYLWQVVDLRLIYHNGGVILSFPVFYLEREYFCQTVFWPGGLVGYISAFLAQFFHIGWAGALIVTGQAWLLWLCTGAIIKRASDRQLNPVRFVPPILVLLLYCQYIYEFGVMMGLLTALGFVCLYLKIPVKSKLSALLAFLVLSVILYAIAGGAAILFVVICGFYELFLKHRLILGLTFLLSAPIAAYIVSLTVFNIGLISVFNNFIPRYQKGDIGNIFRLTAVYALYLLLPLTLVCLWLVELLRKRMGKVVLHGRPTAATTPPMDTQKTGQSPLNWFIAWSWGKISQTYAPLLAIIAGVLIAYFYHNSVLKTQIAVNYWSCNGMWPQILEVYTLNPRNKFINHAADRALFHTGRLTQDMFAYGQQPEGLMLPNDGATPLGMWRLFDTYIDLGQINLAQYSLAMLMDMYGEQSIFLKRLALVTMIKGDISAARVYLGALSRTLFEANWAKSYLEKIERDPNLSTDKEIQRLRGMMPTTDRDFGSLNENIFFDLLDKNRHNRMAFEYLEAFYLLTNQLDKFVGMLDRLNDFDYDKIPRVYEEAMLLYSYNTKKKIEVPGHEISRESQERFGGFTMVYTGRYKKNKPAAFNELAKDYGDSYFFYYIYGPAGIKK